MNQLNAQNFEERQRWRGRQSEKLWPTLMVETILVKCFLPLGADF